LLNGILVRKETGQGALVWNAIFGTEPEPINITGLVARRYSKTPYVFN
jgi:hypothetical protein